MVYVHAGGRATRLQQRGALELAVQARAHQAEHAREVPRRAREGQRIVCALEEQQRLLRQHANTLGKHGNKVQDSA